VSEQPGVTFGWLLKRLRIEAGLTQEQLAAAAGLSPRSVSDLERGINQSARRDTARLLADALHLSGTARAGFEAAARARAANPGAPGDANSMRSGAVAAASRTLPRDAASFVGREAELARLMETVSASAGTGVVGVHAIGGMAGVGKTTFAVHAAHRLAAFFPDGQIFLRLHAHTPGQRPVEPAEALANLLLTAGVAAEQIPPALEARMGLWRTHLAGRRLLLILDDAAGHEQIRPLLPGTAGSLVLVTSRRHLTALDDCAVISLDTLSSDQAAALLIRLAARTDIVAADPAVGEITRLCGYLPLAIGMLARQLHHHPAWTVAGLAAELAAARDRLELMHAENLSVAAAFDLSYQDLDPSRQRLFRRLGLHPGPDIDAGAAGALDGISLADARRSLDDLYDHYLIAEPVRGRYRMHDLIREHARALVVGSDAEESDAAVGRVLDYYVHSAVTAGRHFNRGGPGLAEAPAWMPELATREQAAAWLSAERANLKAAADYATLRGWPGGIAIPVAIAGFLRTHGHWAQAIALHQSALAAARQTGDRRAQAACLTNLGIIERLTGDYGAAIATLTEASALHRALADPHGQATALLSLGVVQRLAVDYRTAAATLTEGLQLFESSHDQLGRADTLNELGVVHRHTRDYDAAIKCHERALELNRGLGDQFGEADSLRYLARAQAESGNYGAVFASYAEALRLYRELDERLGEAHALNYIGLAQSVTADYEAAADTLLEALALYRTLGHRLGQAEVHNNLGELLCISEPDRARAHHEEALGVARQILALLEEARAFEGIGNIDIQNGNTTDGAGQLRHALETYQRIGSPYGARAQETLRYHGL
jgi:tetratricopeptide (TPR) repeat protein/transcriptional regulator with XRE-family HTH domain